MVSDDRNVYHLLAEHYLEDAGERIRYQHDFAQAAFKTLILINGGAIVAMLTYAGNVMKDSGPHALALSFIWYCVGVVSTVFANVTAYLSQGIIQNASIDEAARLLGIENRNPSPKAAYFGTAMIWLSVMLCFLSLVGFVAGSFCALNALAK